MKDNESFSRCQWRKSTRTLSAECCSVLFCACWLEQMASVICHSMFLELGNTFLDKNSILYHWVPLTKLATFWTIGSLILFSLPLSKNCRKNVTVKPFDRPHVFSDLTSLHLAVALIFSPCHFNLDCSVGETIVTLLHTHVH